MLIFAMKPGHDGSIAAIEDGRLLFCYESEKDSYARHAAVSPMTVLAAAEDLGRFPDVLALGGWGEKDNSKVVGAGYSGVNTALVSDSSMFGEPVKFFSSTHERSHIAMSVGMAPPNDASRSVVLVWEGDTGAFYLVDEQLRVEQTFPVMTEPGARFAFLFALADPTFTDDNMAPRLNDAGKLMALAAYGNPQRIDTATGATMDRLLKLETVYPMHKSRFMDSPLYNCGVESELHKDAAASLTDRIFEAFWNVAREQIPPDLPLRISGGCGLNCDWNVRWRETGHFSSVFVPPCTNDSGSAIGTAIDAQAAVGGGARVDWDVYAGKPFVQDMTVPSGWARSRLREDELARTILGGEIVAWVQGRWELGPRALGHRSLLGNAFRADTRDRLNAIKQRESYRPIAPCCRIEDASLVFESAFEDPWMLYFRNVCPGKAPAVTHVDGTARAQTVRRSESPELHGLLTAVAEASGAGVLCNTSLNFSGRGFINSMSDLINYCDTRGVDHFVVHDQRYARS